MYPLCWIPLHRICHSPRRPCYNREKGEATRINTTEYHLINEIERVDTIVIDWATWDDTYQVVTEGSNSTSSASLIQYVTENAVPSIFSSIDINYFLIFDDEGREIFSTGYDGVSDSVIPVPEELHAIPLLITDLQNKSSEFSMRGLVMTRDGSVLIAARRVLPSQKGHPPRGLLIAGRVFDDKLVAWVEANTDTSFSIEGENSSRNRLEIVTMGEKISGYGSIPSITRKEPILFRIERPREIYSEGIRTVWSYLAVILALIGVSGLFVLWYTKKYLIIPITHLVREIKEIEDRPTGARISLEGFDEELAGVTTSINSMIGALEERAIVIAEQKEAYRSLSEHIMDAVFQYDFSPEIGFQGKISEVNPAACRLLSHHKEQILGRPLADFLEGESAVLDQGLTNLISKGSCLIEALMRTSDGRRIPVELASGIFSYAGGHLAITSARDISSRKHAEAEIARANRKLRLMNEVTWQDIKNKVTALRGYVSLMRNQNKNSKFESFLTRSEGLLQTIHHVIDLTKEYQQIGAASTRWMEVEKMVQEAVAQVSMGKMKITTDLKDLEILTDPIMVRVFVHLIENALTHGETVTEIVFSISESPDGLILRCADDGVRISDAKRDTIFQRNIAQGRGFGLFYSRDILELQNMEISDKSPQSGGAVFEILVPEGMYRFKGDEKTL